MALLIASALVFQFGCGGSGSSDATAAEDEGPGPFATEQYALTSNGGIASVTASSAQSGYPASAAIDANFATRWSAFGVGQWIAADLGATQSVQGLQVAWYRGNSRRYAFTIGVSADGTTYKQVFSGTSSGATLNFEQYTFAAVSGRYVKLTVNGNSQNRFAAVTELAVSLTPGSAPAPLPVTVAVTPQTASLAEGASTQLSASVTGSSNTSVTWSVQEGAAGGTVSGTGFYTAPAAAGTFHVVAASAADPTKTSASTITVSAPVVAATPTPTPTPTATATPTPTPTPVVSVGVSPASASVSTGGSAQFTATVSGTTNTSVIWTVQEGAAGGAVSSTGLYTAPSAAGTYHVVAKSQADSTKSGTATVTVTAPVSTPPVTPTGAITSSPSSLALGSVYAGQTRAYPIVIKNVTGGSITIASVDVAGAGLSHKLALPRTLAAGSSTWFGVYYSPTSPGALSGSLVLRDGSGTALASISITGSSVALDSTNSVNVASYGAKGDGVTDDRGAFQSAANAAGTGKVLYVPQPPGGQYYKLTGAVTIQGSVVGAPGATKPEIRMSGANGQGNPGGVDPYCIFWYQGNTSGTVITGLHLNGGVDFPAGTNVYGMGEYSEGLVLQNVSNVWIENNIIEATQGDNITLGGAPNTSPIANARIINNVLRHPMRCAIFPGDTSGLQVYMNTITKAVEYQSAIDFEPNVAPQADWNAEVAYNNFDTTLQHDHGLITSTVATGIPSPGGNINVHGNWGTTGSYSFYVDITPSGSTWSGNTIQTTLPTTSP